jgi:hypothetical protein
MAEDDSGYNKLRTWERTVGGGRSGEVSGQTGPPDAKERTLKNGSIGSAMRG